MCEMRFDLDLMQFHASRHTPAAFQALVSCTSNNWQPCCSSCSSLCGSGNCRNISSLHLLAAPQMGSAQRRCPACMATSKWANTSSVHFLWCAACHTILCRPSIAWANPMGKLCECPWSTSLGLTKFLCEHPIFLTLPVKPEYGISFTCF